jgi:hypothetical protein
MQCCSYDNVRNSSYNTRGGCSACNNDIRNYLLHSPQARIHNFAHEIGNGEFPAVYLFIWCAKLRVCMDVCMRVCALVHECVCCRGNEKPDSGIISTFKR